MRRWLTSAAALAQIFAALFGAASLAHAQRGQTAGSTASLAGDLGWPRDFDVGSDQLEIQGCVLGFLCGGETWSRVGPPIPASGVAKGAKSSGTQAKTAAPAPKTTGSTAPGQKADTVGDICLLPDIARLAH